MAKQQKGASQTTRIPSYGRSAPCEPCGVQYIAQQGMIKWSWDMGQFSWLKVLIWVCPISLLIGIGGLIIGIAFDAWYLIVLGCIQVTFFGTLTSILTGWMWNITKQGAISLARFKSQEAMKLWSNVHPTMSLYAKDVYFETQYGGKQLKVLRDGTIEVHGSHNDAGDGSSDLYDDAKEMAMDYITDNILA